MRRAGSGSGIVLICGLIFTLVGAVFLGITANVTVQILGGAAARQGDLLVVPLIFGLLGAAAAIVGILILRSLARARRRRVRLLEQGEVIWADITGFPPDYSVRINGRHTFRIECSYTDPLTGTVHTFRSGTLRTNPSRYVTQTRIRVYAGRGSDYQEYFVDVDSVLAKTELH